MVLAVHVTAFPRRSSALVRFREGPTVEASHWTEGPLGRLSAQLEGSCALHCCGSSKALWQGAVSLSPSLDDPSIEVRPSRAPAAWDVSSPTLHTLNCTLRLGTRPPEKTSLRFGFRSFRAVGGRFELNGRPIFLRGNSVNPPYRYIDDAVAFGHAFAYDYLRDLKRRGINAVRIGDGASISSQAWYDAADELGVLIYAGPYGNPVCPGCKAKPPTRPPPAGSAAAALARYQALLMVTANHPSHVVLILGNEMDISGPHGHWGDAPFYRQYADLLRQLTRQLEAFDGERAYLGDAGFGEGLGGQIFDDHTYYGWYQGDPSAYYLHEAGGARGVAQPQTFTESVGNYLTAGGDFDVSGKNWAWALKWAGASQFEGTAARHAAWVQRRSAEIVRRNRALNPHLAGLMQFAAPFFYCGASVRSFGDAAAAPSPMLVASERSFAPILLSIESWAPHAYVGGAVQLTVHVVNDDDAGADLGPTTVTWSLECGDGGSGGSGGGGGGGGGRGDGSGWQATQARCAPPVASLPRGAVHLPPLAYYGVQSAPLTLSLPPALPAGCDSVVCRVSASLREGGAPTKPSCADTPGWRSVFGAGCDAFVTDGHCGGGAFLPGHEWAAGAKWGHPEQHCCACSSKLAQQQKDAEAARPPLATTSEPLTLFAPLDAPEGGAATPLPVYDPGAGGTVKALRASGVAVEPVATLDALRAVAPSRAVVVGESLDGQWRGGALVAVLRARLAAGGRLLLLQQAGAADFDDGAVRGLLDPALQVFAPTVTLPHSGRTLPRGEPVHIQRRDHRLFRTPHAINGTWLERWALLTPWQPQMAQPSNGATLPHTSPMSSGVTLDVSRGADRESADANARALRRVAPLLTHAMGSADIVLSEVFYPPPATSSAVRADGGGVGGGGSGGTSGGRRGVALVCGLGLAARLTREPVADRLLRNLLAYLRADGGGGGADASPQPHALFAAGETISWGYNYSSEKGVAWSGPASGLLIEPCAYDEGCGWQGTLGMPACGRFPFGPYDFTWMGHTHDQAPEQAWGSAVVTLRTTAARTLTTFHATQGVQALPTMEALLLSDDFSVAARTSCAGRWADGAPQVECRLAALGCRDEPAWSNGHGKDCAAYAAEGWCAGGNAAAGAEWTLGAQFRYPERACCACGRSAEPATGASGAAAQHVSLRVSGPKTTTMKRTVFLA